MMKQAVKIGNKIIKKGRPVFIVAEAGVNHNGSLMMAKKLVDAAKSAGADAVKFQTFKTEALVTASAPKAAYQSRAVPGKSQYRMLKKLELPEVAFVQLFRYCGQRKIIFLSTPFDAESAAFLQRLGVPAFKIGSGELTNLPLLSQIARYQKPVILSTGMATAGEIKDARQAIYKAGNKKLVLLHCTSNYPTAYQDVNLMAMRTLAEDFNVLSGYSDHTPGMEVAVAAVVLGGCVIEKHLTLSKSLPGPDHRASLNPEEFQAMVTAIRNTEKALGTGIKEPQKSEIEIRKIARKSIVAARDIFKGARLTQEMLTFKRPGTGIEPKYLNALIGRTAKIRIKKDSLLTWKAL